MMVSDSRKFQLHGDSLGIGAKYFRETDPLQHRPEAVVNFGNRIADGTRCRMGAAFLRFGLVALREFDRFIEGIHEVGQGGVGGVHRQVVAAMYAAAAFHKLLMAKVFKDIRDEGPTQIEMSGDFA